MRVAKSYNGYKYDETKAYEKGGKLYVHATCKCDRCTKGVFVTRVENGQPIPHPYAQGVCFRCGGTGYLAKEIRLYSDKEYEQMERAAEKAKEKKLAEQEAKMKAEFASKKAAWLQHNGFDAEGNTFLYIKGDSYAIKDELKDAGFHWCGLLKRWMRGSADNYEDRVIKVKAENILEFSAWGEGHYFSDAKNYIDKLVSAIEAPTVPSEYIGEVGDRTSFNVTLIKIGGFSGRYGYTYVYSFKDKNENLLTWMSAKNIGREVGESFLITGTIKNHQEYNHQKVTYITRCVIK